MMYTTTGTITPTPPFDFAQSLGFLGAFKPMQGEHTITLLSLTKAVREHGQTVVFEVASAGITDAPCLRYTLYADEPISDALHAAMADRIAFFLSTADDLRPLYDLGADDPHFAPIIEQLYGYHQVKFTTPFENACWAILIQRNTAANARTMKQAVMDHFGGALTVGDVRYRVFPDAAQMADAGVETLTALIRHTQKGPCLHAVAAAFADVDEAWLCSAPYDQVAAWLREIKGIGAWSSAFVLLRGLGRMERIPPGEQALIGAVANVYNAGVPLQPAHVQRLAARYNEQQGYWAHYLRVAGS